MRAKRFHSENSSAKWLFEVIWFDVNEKPLGDYIPRRNNFGLIYEISKDIATEKAKMEIFDDATLI